MDDVELQQLISDCLRDFHDRRLAGVQAKTLRQLVRRKNPYMIKALGNEMASEYVKALLEAHLSSSDESIFGDAFFEPIARIASGGKASEARGVDVVIETDSHIAEISVKSGPNPYNSRQFARQSDDFNELRGRLYKLGKIYDPVLAHSYGRRVGLPTQSRVYRVTSGQAFWEEFTGDSDFYLKLITLMHDEPLKYKERFAVEWAAVQNRFTKEFLEDFCFESGHVNWEFLVRYVSGKTQPRLPRRRRRKQS